MCVYESYDDSILGDCHVLFASYAFIPVNSRVLYIVLSCNIIFEEATNLSAHIKLFRASKTTHFIQE